MANTFQIMTISGKVVTVSDALWRTKVDRATGIKFQELEVFIVEQDRWIPSYLIRDVEELEQKVKIMKPELFA